MVTQQITDSATMAIKMIAQMLTDTQWGRSVIEYTYPSYFPNEDFQKVVAIIKDYHDRYSNMPNIDSIETYARKNFKKELEIQPILGILSKVKAYKESILKQITTDDTKFIQDYYTLFIRQQELNKILSDDINKIKNEAENNINPKAFEKIPDLFEKLNRIGDTESNVVDIYDNLEEALTPGHRLAIPTGIGLDDVMDGGLAKGEFGIILAAMGMGKSTMLCCLGLEAMKAGYNTLHLYFEGLTAEDKAHKYKDIKRKYISRMINIPLSKLDAHPMSFKQAEIAKFREKYKKGCVKLEKFDGDGITIRKIKNLIKKYEKEMAIKFDMLILDYVDLVESIGNYKTIWDGQYEVINSLERMVSELNIACWTATQANKDSTDSKKSYLYLNDSGGSVQKGIKASFFISLARTPEQKVAKVCNSIILKSRFSGDGHRFENMPFDNDAMKIDFPASKHSQFKYSEDDFGALIN